MIPSYSEGKSSMRVRYLVSACLAGEKCRYDGSSCIYQKVVELVSRGEAIPFCPEVAGGLGIPRERSEIQRVPDQAIVPDGTISHKRVKRPAPQSRPDLLIRPDRKIRVITQSGCDVTHNFLKGAEEALRIVRQNRIECAILKSLSPSCGFGSIYDGSFSGKLMAGEGVTAALLYGNGVKVLSEKEVDSLPF